jgi:chlorobactene glucosyltransferase
VSHLAAALLLAAPWVVAPIVTVVRVRHSRSLDDESPEPPADPPSVSLVIPARNEARNIRRCVESALASSYPGLEVIVVDDHSTDDTGRIVHELAARDARLRVVVPPPLPAGWFGKQWACTAGAQRSGGAIIGFLDADTWQRGDLVPRVVNAMSSRGADLLSVAGTQELGTFWERVVQPQVFGTLAARFGGTESVNGSRFASQKIANGQCLFVRREAYDALGGHASVRDRVAEDLALAQHFFLAGRRTTLVLGQEQLRTRMYTSLRELIDGWGKNIYAGGIDAVPFGRAGRALFPFVLLTPGLSGVLPALLLVLSAGGVLGGTVLVWAAVAIGANLVWWAVVYRWLGLSPGYAALHPLGAGLLLYISVRAIVRGRRVEWKGREYRTA